MGIMNYLKNLKSRIFKEDVVETDSINVKMLTDTVTAYKKAYLYFENTPIRSEQVKIYSATLNIKKKDNGRSVETKNFIHALYLDLEKVLQNAVILSSINDRELEDITITASIPADKANLIKISDAMVFISNFATTFLNYIMSLEMLEYKLFQQEGVKIPKYTVTYVIDNLPKFFTCLEEYSVEKEEFEKKVTSIPPMSLNKKSKDVVSTLHNIDIDPFGDLIAFNNFSPIYIIRSTIAAYQADRYDRMVLEKKVSELKLMYLESLKNDENNASLLDEIQRLESKIASLARKIDDINEDTGINK